MVKVDESLVLEIARKHYNETPKIEKFYSESNYVAKLKFKNSNKIIKANISDSNWKLEKEVYIFEILKNHNIPTPDIEFIDLSRKEFPQYYIMEDLGNNSLIALHKSNSKEAKQIYEKMGEYFALVHSIKFDKQGFISPKGIIEKSFYDHNKQMFKEILNKLIELKELSQIEVKKCKEIFSNFKDSKESVLCHMDFGPWQVIIDDKEEKITGIIDWEWSQSSNSIGDFANAQMLMTIFGGKIDCFRKGYEKIKKLPGNYDEINKAYMIPNILNIMYHFKVGNNEFNYKKCRDFFDKLLFR